MQLVNGQLSAGIRDELVGSGIFDEHANDRVWHGSINHLGFEGLVVNNWLRTWEAEIARMY